MGDCRRGGRGCQRMEVTETNDTILASSGTDGVVRL